jgi:hypothetical protein
VLSYLRKRKYTLGRSILSIVAGMWLIAFSQTCLAAAESFIPENAAMKNVTVASMAATHKPAAALADLPIASSDCPPSFCTVSNVLDLNTVHQKNTVNKLPDHALANLTTWDPPRPKPYKSRSGKVYLADYIPLHPTLRFCILRC